MPIGDYLNAGTAVLGMVGNAIGQNNQNAQTEHLMSIQHQNQMALNLQNQQIQQQNWDYTNYENQVKHMKNAGLNVGLMYGGGGGGGSTMGGGSGGSAAMGSAAQSPNYMELGAQMLQARAIQAEVDLKKAQENKIKAETPTTGNLGDMTLANLRQSGISGMLDNSLKAWMQGDTDTRGGYEYDKTLDYHTQVGESSNAAKQIDAALLKTASETNSNLANIDLTNQKIQGYWTELLNETKKADAAGIQAAAQKLSAEWNTGEFTNWKTWADQAQKAVQAIGSITKGNKTVNVTNPTTTNNNY